MYHTKYFLQNEWVQWNNDTISNCVFRYVLMRYMHNEWNEEKKDEYFPFSPLFITNTSTGNWGENVFLFVYVVMSKQSAYHSTSFLIRISFLGRCVHVELEITLEYWIFDLLCWHIFIKIRNQVFYQWIRKSSFGLFW